MTRARELLASAQMRDRIVSFLKGEADIRDKRRPHENGDASPKARLLRGMATMVGSFPAEIAHGDAPVSEATSPEMQDIIRRVTT